MGALPARNPFRWTRSRNCSATFAVSFSTSSWGIEISSSCLQPSTNANLGLPRREKNGTEIPEYQRLIHPLVDARNSAGQRLFDHAGKVVIDDSAHKRLAGHVYRRYFINSARGGDLDILIDQR